MAREKTSYRRKLSSEEAREQYIFVTKDALGFFPPLGQPFDLSLGGNSMRVELSAIDCSCVGEPHQHYRIEAAELAQFIDLFRGAVISIAKGEDGGYSLSASTREATR